jgi:hypothetical protein
VNFRLWPKVFPLGALTVPNSHKCFGNMNAKSCDQSMYGTFQSISGTFQSIPGTFQSISGSGGLYVLRVGRALRDHHGINRPPTNSDSNSISNY